MRGIVGLAIFAAALAGCSSGPKTHETRGWSDHYAFRVTADVIPPRVGEPIHFRVFVRDKSTGQPVETGEGRIYGQSQDGARADNGFTKEKELGTYSARIVFPVTGDWAMGLQFRGEKNPKMPLEKIDWIQEVVEASVVGK